MTKLAMYVDGSEFIYESGLRAAWGVLAQHVGNCRADHLARVACLDEKYIDYDKWIPEGFETWDSAASQMTRVKPAFAE